MSSFVKVMLVMGALSFQGVALASWETDCQSLQNAQNPCSPIQKQVQVLADFITPAPFVSTTINQFPEGVFPKGNPWGSSSTGGGGTGGGSTVLQSSTGGGGTGNESFGSSGGSGSATSNSGAGGSWQ